MGQSLITPRGVFARYFACEGPWLASAYVTGYRASYSGARSFHGGVGWHTRDRRGHPAAPSIAKVPAALCIPRPTLASTGRNSTGVPGGRGQKDPRARLLDSDLVGFGAKPQAIPDPRAPSQSDAQARSLVRRGGSRSLDAGCLGNTCVGRRRRRSAATRTLVPRVAPLDAASERANECHLTMNHWSEAAL
jgi:hypothetical protein